MDDKELVERFRTGDRDAGQRLWDQYGNWLFNVALRKLNGHRQDAEDAVQRTFVALMNYDKEIEHLRAWLKIVVVRTAVSEARRKKPRLTGEVHEPQRDSRSSGLEAEEYLAAWQQWDSVLQALNQTDQRVMKLDVLGKMSGWSDGMLAQEMGIIAPVYSQKRVRARKRVEKALLLLHMLQSERKACEELRRVVDCPANGVDPQLTPRGLKDGIAHLKRCEGDCKNDQKKFRDLCKLPAVVLVPSPQLRDRVSNVGDAVRLENESANPRERRNPDVGAEDTHAIVRRTTTRVGTQASHRAVSPAAPRPLRPPRPMRRAASAIGAGILASLLAITVIDTSGADISLPKLEFLPGAEASAGTDGGTDGGGTTDDGGTTDGGTEEGGVVKSPGETVGPSVPPKRRGDVKPPRDTTGPSVPPKEGGVVKSPGDTVGPSVPPKESGGVTPRGKTVGPSVPPVEGGVVNPPEDTTDPSISLVNISTVAVGQQVVGAGGSLMQTCGPQGTPTTYSVWVAASDPSGIRWVMLYVQHPTDATYGYQSSAGVAEGDAIRFDVPAYRKGPKAQDEVELRVSAMAKDMKGNRTDIDLGTLSLYECGEPG
jgi:RNA polymerase sigma factor (sigma-70 family)